MEMRQFLAIDAVARFRSITAAAQQLNLTEQALSKTIRNTESELGFQIFQRQHSGTVLTEKGEQLYRCILPLLAEYQLTMNKIERIPRYRDSAIHLGVSLGAFMTITYTNCIALLDKFHRVYPKAQFTSYEYPDRVVEEMLLKGELDLALSLLPQSPGILFNKLQDYRLSVYLSVDHPLAGREKLTFPELKNENFAMVTRDMQFSSITAERCRKHGFEPSVVMVSSDINSILEKIKAGNCIFVGMNMVPTGNGVTRVYLEEPDFYWSTCLCYTKQTLQSREKSKLLRCMSDFFRDEAFPTE